MKIQTRVVYLRRSFMNFRDSKAGLSKKVLNQTGFEIPVTEKVFSSCRQVLEHEFSNKISIESKSGIADMKNPSQGKSLSGRVLPSRRVLPSGRVPPLLSIKKRGLDSSLAKNTSGWTNQADTKPQAPTRKISQN